MPNFDVCVLGGGIVGLTTALCVKRQYSSSNVTIIASKFTTDTTSDGAAGLFEPHPSFLGPDLQTTRKWVKDSFLYYDYLRLHSERCHITQLSGYNFSNHSQEAVENDYMKLVTSDYRQLTDEEREVYKGRFRFGTYFTTMVIPCRMLLPYYMHVLQSEGVKIINSTVRSLDELKKKYAVVFNCSGLGAKFLCRDFEVVPIRGQIIQVQAPWVKNFYTCDFITYIIPCGYDGVVTLGGTQDFGYFRTTVDEYVSASIRHRCEEILPQLKKAPVVRNWVGLRPYRTRVRVELEDRSADCAVIHNYGHGGFGVTTAPGSAMYAIDLLKEHRQRSGHFNTSSKL